MIAVLSEEPRALDLREILADDAALDALLISPRTSEEKCRALTELLRDQRLAEASPQERNELLFALLGAWRQVDGYGPAAGKPSDRNVVRVLLGAFIGALAALSAAIIWGLPW